MSGKIQQKYSVDRSERNRSIVFLSHIELFSEQDKLQYVKSESIQYIWTDLKDKRKQIKKERISHKNSRANCWNENRTK